MMRHVARGIGSTLLLCLIVALLLFAWVREAVANVEPSSVCLAERTRRAVVNGTFPLAQQDLVVSKTIGFQKGVPDNMFWWHLRGWAIHTIYVSFWSDEERRGVFNELAPGLRTCPPGLY
jgi:hypothetical protein